MLIEFDYEGRLTPSLPMIEPLQAGEQGRAVLLQPGVKSGCGMAEMQLLEALDQIKGRGEGALGRLPGVGHRPEPGQIEVGMAQHMHPARRARRGLLLKPGLEGCGGSESFWIKPLQQLKQWLLSAGLQALGCQS